MIIMDFENNRELLEEYLDDLKSYVEVEKQLKQASVDDQFAQKLNLEYLFSLICKKWSFKLGYKDILIKNHITELSKKNKLYHLESYESVISDDIDISDWILLDLIRKGSCVIFAGLPKVGKSIWTYNLIASVLLNKSFLNRATKSCNVLHLQLEESKSLRKKRLLRFGLTGEIIGNYYSSRYFDITKDIVKLQDDIEKLSIDLVILDTLRASLEKSGLQDIDQATGNYIGRLQKVAIETDSAIIIVHHLKKQFTGNLRVDISGHGSLFSNSDGAIGLYNLDNSNNIKLITLPRDGNPVEIIYTMEKKGSLTELTVLKDSSIIADIDFSNVIRVMTSFDKYFTIEELSNLSNVDSIKINKILDSLIDYDVCIYDEKNIKYKFDFSKKWLFEPYLDTNKKIEFDLQKLINCTNYDEVLEVTKFWDKTYKKQIYAKLSDYEIQRIKAMKVANSSVELGF